MVITLIYSMLIFGNHFIALHNDTNLHAIVNYVQ